MWRGGVVSVESSAAVAAVASAVAASASVGVEERAMVSTCEAPVTL